MKFWVKKNSLVNFMQILSLIVWVTCILESHKMVVLQNIVILQMMWIYFSPLLGYDYSGSKLSVLINQWKTFWGTLWEFELVATSFWTSFEHQVFKFMSHLLLPRTLVQQQVFHFPCIIGISLWPGSFPLVHTHVLPRHYFLAPLFSKTSWENHPSCLCFITFPCLKPALISFVCPSSLPCGHMGLLQWRPPFFWKHVLISASLKSIQLWFKTSGPPITLDIGYSYLFKKLVKYLCVSGGMVCVSV